MIPNRATRWASLVFILIGLFGGYGVFSEWSWPAEPKNVFAALGVVLMATLAVRSLRAGVLVDDSGLVSRAELATRRLRWREIERFDSRGATIRNEVGAITVNGDWVPLQNHPYAEDYVKLLEQARGSNASGADLQAAAEASARRTAGPSTGSARRRPWWFAIALLGFAALLALVVRLNLLPLGVVLVIAAVAVVPSILGRRGRRRQ